MLAVALVDDLRCRSAEDLVVSRMDAGPEKTRQSIDLIRLHLAALCCSPGTRVVVGFRQDGGSGPAAIDAIGTNPAGR